MKRQVRYLFHERAAKNNRPGGKVQCRGLAKKSRVERCLDP
jgi:hypothetical protein